MCSFTISDQCKQGVKMPDNKTRKILRLPYFDYSQEGVYFVTLVTQGRTKLFSEVNQEEVSLFPAGKMVERWWYMLAEKFLKVKPREYIIMPNHFHGIIEFTTNHLSNARIDDEVVEIVPVYGNGDNSQTLSQVIQWFKTMTTNEYIRQVKRSGWEPFDHRLWQRNYYEHIIRNDVDYERIYYYIQSNPQQWGKDQENPNNLTK